MKLLVRPNTLKKNGPLLFAGIVFKAHIELLLEHIGKFAVISSHSIFDLSGYFVQRKGTFPRLNFHLLPLSSINVIQVDQRSTIFDCICSMIFDINDIEDKIETVLVTSVLLKESIVLIEILAQKQTFFILGEPRGRINRTFDLETSKWGKWVTFCWVYFTTCASSTCKTVWNLTM